MTDASAGRLVQIVPTRVAAAEGVGDYSLRIAEALLDRHGIRTEFISIPSLDDRPRRADEWATAELPRRSVDDLVAALDKVGDAPVLLQLSGYGFNRKGIALWVAEALRRWRRKGAGGPLLTVFHELYATGPIWSSPFWLGWAQILGVKRIYRLSDAAIATTELNVSLLGKWVPGGPPLSWMPCFATIGEPAGPTRGAMEREPVLAIFGRSAMAEIVYDQYLATIEGFVRANGITRILDIGARSTPPPAQIAGVPVESRGELAPAPLVEALSSARFGLIVYNGDYLAKSSTFAAFCAAGTIPMCISPNAVTGGRDRICAGREYLLLDPAKAPPAPDRDEIIRLQAAARSWYEPHAIAPAVDLIHRHLFTPAGSNSRT